MTRRHRGSRDRNHPKLSARFEAWGCSVGDMALAGVPDFPDVVVGYLGTDHLVEYKNPETRYGRAGLNPGQAVFARDWRGGKVWVVSSELEVDALVTNWRREASQKRGKTA